MMGLCMYLVDFASKRVADLDRPGVFLTMGRDSEPITAAVVRRRAAVSRAFDPADGHPSDRWERWILDWLESVGGNAVLVHEYEYDGGCERPWDVEPGWVVEHPPWQEWGGVA